MKHVLKVLAAILLAGGLLAMGGLVGQTVAGRIGYPFDLEWMEGGMLVHALRVAEGKPLYVEPSADFIPYIYPPMYAWVTGFLGRFTDVSYGLGRGVSVAGIAVAAFLLGVAVWRERMGPWMGMGAAALFLSTYDDCGAFFDLVRTDGLLAAFTAGALVACRSGGPVAVRVGGILLALAFATKHNTAILGLPIFWVLQRFHGWRRAWSFALWSAGPALAFVLAVQVGSGGRFLQYLVLAPASHPMVGSRLFPGSEKELLLAFPVSLGAAVLAGIVGRILDRRASCQPQDPFGRAYWLWILVTVVVSCILMRGHHGGFLNVLIPGYWMLAFVAAWAFGRLEARTGWSWLPLVLGGCVALDVWRGAWEPARYVPTAEDRQAGQAVLDRIASYPGDVLMPQSPYYPVLVGKKPSFHQIALWDVTHERTPFPDADKAVTRAIESGSYDAIILASPRFGHGVEKAYRAATPIRIPGRAFFPKTGWRARPRLVWERRGSDEPESKEGSPFPGEPAQEGAPEEAEEPAL